MGTTMTETVAIIPARGGSQRIPGKNLERVDGKPLVAHAVEDVVAAARVDRAVVSTDDEEIATVAREHGGEVPFIRPESIATDDAPVAAAVTHALDWLADVGDEFDVVSLVQPTSPLREPRDIDGALERLASSGADSVVSVSEYVTPPQWAVTTDERGYLSEYFDDGALWGDSPERSQELVPLTHPNGAVFAATTEAWRTHETFYTPSAVGYEMPPERSFDVDEPWELDLVRSILE